MARTKKEATSLYIGVGRRKSSVASAFLNTKKGDITVNGKDINEYFATEVDKTMWIRPFHVLGVSHPNSAYSATVRVTGSGKTSQLDAVTLAFAKALVEINPENRLILRKNGLLTRDPREVERKKPFLRKARKSPQYSKR